MRNVDRNPFFPFSQVSQPTRRAGSTTPPPTDPDVQFQSSSSSDIADNITYSATSLVRGATISVRESGQATAMDRSSNETPSLPHLPSVSSAYDRIRNMWAPAAPRNFGKVHDGVYRSGFPTTENFSFLAEKRIKTIVTFVPEAYTVEQTNFLHELGIKHIRIPIEANKDSFHPRPHTPVVEAIGHLLDKSNYPILIHCNKGKHRTGCVVACYRKVLGWGRARVLQEYRNYAGIKARALDEIFIDSFDERAMQIVAVQDNLIDSYNEPASDSPIASLIPNSRLRG